MDILDLLLIAYERIYKQVLAFQITCLIDVEDLNNSEKIFISEQITSDLATLAIKYIPTEEMYTLRYQIDDSSNFELDFELSNWFSSFEKLQILSFYYEYFTCAKNGQGVAVTPKNRILFYLVNDAKSLHNALRAEEDSENCTNNYDKLLSTSILLIAEANYTKALAILLEILPTTALQILLSRKFIWSDDLENLPADMDESEKYMLACFEQNSIRFKNALKDTNYQPENHLFASLLSDSLSLKNALKSNKDNEHYLFYLEILSNISLLLIMEANYTKAFKRLIENLSLEDINFVFAKKSMCGDFLALANENKEVLHIYLHRIRVLSEYEYYKRKKSSFVKKENVMREIISTFFTIQNKALPKEWVDEIIKPFKKASEAIYDPLTFYFLAKKMSLDTSALSLSFLSGQNTENINKLKIKEITNFKNNINKTSSVIHTVYQYLHTNIAAPFYLP